MINLKNQNCENCRFSFKRKEDNVLLCAKTINVTQPENWCKTFKKKK